MTLIEASLLVIVVLMVLVLVALSKILAETRLNHQTLSAIETLQLNPRTRIAQARMDNGPDTMEKVGRRAGQVSRGRRVVVGGDTESQLHRDLSHGVEVTDDG